MKYLFLIIFAFNAFMHTMIISSDLTFKIKEKFPGQFKRNLYKNENKVGFIRYNIFKDNNDISRLRIVKQFKKQGHGTDLLLCALNHLISINTEPTRVICNPELAQFYQRVGFKIVDIDKSAATMWYYPTEGILPQHYLDHHNSQKQKPLSVQ